MKLCNKFADTPWGPLQLEQHSGGKFLVTYGKEQRNWLLYADAAYEYGCCIMHWLACEGKLDNQPSPAL
jgi:hypothetical protein